MSMAHDERFDVFLPLLKTPETVLQLLRFAKVPDDHREVLYRHEGLCVVPACLVVVAVVAAVVEQTAPAPACRQAGRPYHFHAT